MFHLPRDRTILKYLNFWILNWNRRQFRIEKSSGFLSSEHWGRSLQQMLENSRNGDIMGRFDWLSFFNDRRKPRNDVNGPIRSTTSITGVANWAGVILKWIFSRPKTILKLPQGVRFESRLIENSEKLINCIVYEYTWSERYHTQKILEFWFKIQLISCCEFVIYCNPSSEKYPPIEIN